MFVLFLAYTAISAQVTGVKYLITYNMERCSYTANIVVTNGNAITIPRRSQFNSLYTIVVPTGSVFALDTFYNPIVDNQLYLGTKPTSWTISSFVIAPLAQPQHDFYAIRPEISPACFYNDITEGDTIPLFGFTISPHLTCSDSIRTYKNPFGAGADPNPDPDSSQPGMNGSDFSNGFTIGGGIQDYVGNIKTEQPPLPDVNVDISCGDFIFIDVSPVDSMMCLTPYSYSWSGPNYSSTSEDVDIPVASAADYGDYYLTLMDDFGCDTVITITVDPPPNIEMDETICMAGTVDLVASFPTDGIWTIEATNTTGAFIGGTSGGSAQVSFDNTAAGEYFFEYSNGGCVVTKKITVASPGADPIPTTDPVCEGEIIQLNANAGSGATFEWRDSDNNLFSTMENPTIPNANSADAGIYKLQVDIGGCISNATVEVIVNLKPIIVTGNYGPFCIDDGDQTLTGSPIGSGGTWSGTGVTDNGDGTATFDPNNAGSGTNPVTYSYTDPITMCTDTPVATDITVNALPIVTIDGTYGPYCTDDVMVQLMTTPNTGGTWSGNGVDATGMFSPSIGDGTHTITFDYIDPLTNCVGQDMIDIVVNTAPVVSIDGTYGPYCTEDMIVQLMATPSGGDFSGDGVSLSGMFDPSIGGATHTITYSYTDPATNCVGETMIDIIVNDIPTIAIDGTYGPYCIGDATVQLLTTPNNAVVFTGEGVNATGLFDPSFGTGTHTIVFEITDANSCSAKDSIDIIVNNLPTVTIDGTYGPYCEDAAMVQLMTTPSTGGVFSGNGVDASGMFDPNTGAGTYKVIYTFSDGNSCSSKDSIDIIVNEKPTVAIDGTYGPYCIDDEIIALMTIPNTGVIFSGNEVDATGMFDPSVSAGTHTIVFEITDANSCSAKDSIDIIVNDLSTVTIDGTYGPYCIDAAKVQLMTTPTSGGTFSGMGVDAMGMFDPSIGAGVYTITYNFSDANSCSAKDSIDITVNDLPIVTIDDTYGPYCKDAPMVQIVTTPSTGVIFSGAGVSTSGMFDPDFAIGTHTILYEFTDANSCTIQDSFDIVVNGLPDASATTGPAECSENDVQLMETGGEAVSWSWNGPSLTDNTDQNPSILGATPSSNGTYVVVVTDANGCTSSSSVDVTVNPLPSATIDNVSKVCEGGQITLSEIGGDAIEWSWNGPGMINVTEQNPTLTMVNATNIGSYMVQVTDVNGCTNTASVLVEMFADPSANITSNSSVCIGEDITLSENGGSAVSWLWSGLGIEGETDQNPLILGATAANNTTYTVVVTDANGCTSSAQTDVIVNPTPEVFASSGGDICDGGNLQLMETGGDAISWSWNGPSLINDTNQNPTIVFANPSDAGTYIVIVTDNKGCTNSSSIDVVINDLPIVSVENEIKVCAGASVVLDENGGDAVAWIWNGPGLVNQSGQNPTINIVDAATVGAYTVQVTDNKGCTNTAIVNVAMHNAPNIGVTSNGPLCEGTVLVLDENGSSAVSWLWSGPGIEGSIDQTPTISEVTSINNGTYTVTITDGNNCTAETSIDVIVNPTPTANATTGGNVCEGSTLQLMETGGDAISWLWNGPSLTNDTNQNPEIVFANPSDNGTYVVVVTDIKGCTSSSEVEVEIDPLPIASAGNDITDCENSTVILSEIGGDAVSWIWNGPGLTNDVQQSPAIELNAATIGAYTVQVTDNNGCTNTSTVNVAIHNAPNANINSIAPTCEGATIVFDENGGDAISWFWSGPGIEGSIDQNPTITSATSINNATFSVIITDGNSCTAETSIDVIVNPTPTANATTGGNVCEGSTLQFMETGGDATSWSWNGPSLTNDTNQNPEIVFANPSDNGTYVVVVTDINGCTSSSEVEVTINPIPNASAGNDITDCENSTVILSEIGGDAVSWIWNGPGLTNDVQQSPAIELNAATIGAYTVQVTDINGCTNTSTVNIAMHSQPLVNATSNGPICKGQTIVFNEDGGEAVSWTWSGAGIEGANNQNPTIAAAETTSTYSVEITDANGCKRTSSIEVIVNELPGVTITDVYGPYCIDDMSVQIVANPIGGDFSGNGVTASGVFTPIDAGVGSHIITYNFEDINECTGTASTTIIVNDKPTVTIDGNYGPYCTNENPVQLVGTPSNGTYSGTPAITDEGLFDPSFGGGIYTITYEYQDANNCSNSTEIEIVVNDIPVVDAGSYGDVCDLDDAVLLIGSPPNGTFIGDGVTGNNFDPSIGEGTYDITYSFTTIDNCSAESTTQIVVNETPQINNLTVDCADNLLTYTVSFTTTGTISATIGDVGINEITNIPLENGVVITASNNTEDCSVEITITPPQCDCDEVPPTVNTGDQEICHGETIPTLEVTVGVDFTVDWFLNENDVFPLLSGTKTFLPAVGDIGVYTFYTQARNIVDDCVSTVKTPVTLTINAVPNINNIVLDEEICEGVLSSGFEVTSDIVGTTFEWTSTSIGINGNTLMGVGNIPSENLTLTGTIQGTVTYTVIPTLNNCEGAPVDFTVVVNPNPIFTVDTKECSSDLSTYTVTFSTDGDLTILSGGGTIVGNQIIDIPVENNIEVSVENSITTCSITETIEKANCACDVVEAPEGEDIEICFGESTPTLSVNTSSVDVTVDWYDVPSGGIPIEEDNNSYTSILNTIGTYTYYVEARNIGDGCTSDSRTPIVFTIHPLPTFTVDTKECSSDLSTYTVTFSTDGDLTILSGGGTIVGNQIIDIPVENNIEISVENSITTCSITETIDKANCACDVVEAPEGEDVEICIGESTPTLSVTTSSTDITVDWYDMASGGTSLLEAELNYNLLPTAVGTYTYYAEARNIGDGCTSDSRTPIVFTIHPLPTFTVDAKECSSDLSTYTVTFSTDGDLTILSGGGTIVGNQIIDIPVENNIEVSVENSITTCSITETIDKANCACDVVDAPTGGLDAAICFGEANPIFTVMTSGSDVVVDWYDAGTGGTLLDNTYTFSPDDTDAGVYTYYAEARNIVDNCVSDSRIAVIFEIYELPTINIEKKECSIDLTTYSVTFSTTANISMVSGGGILSGNMIIDIPVENNIEVMLVDQETNCETIVEIIKINCDCDEILPPTGLDETICFGETNPFLMASTDVATTSVDWYDSPSGSTPLVEGTFSYQPTDIDAGVYTYYIESVAEDGCISDTRTPIKLIIKPLPEITNTIVNWQSCEGVGISNYTIESDIVGTTFSWISTAVGVTGNVSSGTGDLVFDEVFTLTGTTVGTVTYSVTPSFDGCDGAPVDFVISINPSPDAGPDQKLDCYSNAVTNMNASGTGQWTVISDGTVDVADLNDPNTELSNFSEAGVFKFIWNSNGCPDIIEITIEENCPCVLEENNIIDPVQEGFCMTTDQLTIEGEEGKPTGGKYQWLINKNNEGFKMASGINNEIDYDAFNLGGGSYELRRIYTVEMGTFTCIDTSNIADFFVYDDKFTPGEIMFSPDPLCQGDTLMLEVDFNSVLEYQWTINSGNARVVLEVDSFAMVVVDRPGPITVQVTQSFDDCGVDGLVSNASILEIEVNPIPHPFLGIDTTYCELEESFIITPGEYEDYLWQDGSDNEAYEVTEKGEYSVVVTDSLGCEGSTLLHVKSFCCEFAFPNIFIIDTDTGNESFHVTDVYDCITEATLKVYDRWGNLVYIGPGLESWDGYYKGRKVEQGVYVFIFEYSALDADNNEFEGEEHGDVTVLWSR